MTNLIQKQTFSRPVCWISTIKRIEIQRKKASSLINGNLYHYAGNNPIRYIDPDGREEFDYDQFLRNEFKNYFSDLWNGAKCLFSSDSKEQKTTSPKQNKSPEITFDSKVMLESACNGFSLGSYATQDFPIEGLEAASKYAKSAKNLNALGTAFALYNTYKDSVKAISSVNKAMNPTNEYDRAFGTWNATFDCLNVGCDVLGFFSPTCAMISYLLDLEFKERRSQASNLEYIPFIKKNKCLMNFHNFILELI